MSFAPAVVCLVFIAVHAVNLPTGDEWDAVVPAIVSMADGEFPWKEVYRQDNEHRVVVPHLIQLLLARLTHYDNRVDLYFGWCCLLGTSIVLLLELLRERPLSPRTLLAFLPVNVVLFTWRQSENLIFAYQIHVLLAVFLATLTFFLLRRPTLPRVAVAGVAALSATFSHGIGVLVLPIGLLQLVAARRQAEGSDKRATTRVVAAWLGVGALAYVANFIGYELPSYNPDRAHVLSHPWEGAGFFFAALGSPWAVDAITAIAVGILVAVGYGVAGRSLWRGRERNLIGPLILFSVGCAVLVAVGRSGFRDFAAAIPLRYTTHATPGLAALYLWGVCHASKQPAAKLVLTSWLGVGFALTPAAMRHGLEYAREQAAIRRSVAERLVSHAPLTDAELMQVCPWNPTQIRIQAVALERLGWSVFHGAAVAERGPVLPGSPRFSIDLVNDVVASGAPIVVSTREIVVQGWAVDEVAGRPAGGVRIGVDGQEVTATYGFERSDVATSLGNENYRASGFRAVLPRAPLRPGTHRVSIEVAAAGRPGRYVEVSNVRVEIPD